MNYISCRWHLHPDRSCSEEHSWVSSPLCSEHLVTNLPLCKDSQPTSLARHHEDLRRKFRVSDLIPHLHTRKLKFNGSPADSLPSTDEALCQACVCASSFAFLFFLALLQASSHTVVYYWRDLSWLHCPYLLWIDCLLPSGRGKLQCELFSLDSSITLIPMPCWEAEYSCLKRNWMQSVYCEWSRSSLSNRIKTFQQVLGAGTFLSSLSTVQHIGKHVIV